MVYEWIVLVYLTSGKTTVLEQIPMHDERACMHTAKRLNDVLFKTYYGDRAICISTKTQERKVEK